MTWIGKTYEIYHILCQVVILFETGKEINVFVCGWGLITSEDINVYQTGDSWRDIHTTQSRGMVYLKRKNQYFILTYSMHN